MRAAISRRHTKELPTTWSEPIQCDTLRGAGSGQVLIFGQGSTTRHQWLAARSVSRVSCPGIRYMQEILGHLLSPGGCAARKVRRSEKSLGIPRGEPTEAQEGTTGRVSRQSRWVSEAQTLAARGIQFMNEKIHIRTTSMVARGIVMVEGVVELVTRITWVTTEKSSGRRLVHKLYKNDYDPPIGEPVKRPEGKHLSHWFSDKLPTEQTVIIEMEGNTEAPCPTCGRTEFE